MEEIMRNWGNYIASKKALETVMSLIEKVIEFNKEEKNPFEIVRVGVGGSSLRIDKPKDLDVLIFYKLKKAFEKTYYEFMEFLRQNYGNQKGIQTLWNLKQKMIWKPLENEYGLSLMKKVKNKLTVKEYVEKNYDALLNFGFKPIWLEWVVHQRFSDFLIYDHSFGFMLSFDPDYFVISKIKEELKKKIKLDIQPYFIGQFEDDLVISHLVFWENGKALEISEKEYKRYLKSEWEKLRKQFLELKKMFNDKNYETSLPLETYRYTIEVYRNEYGTYTNISNEIKRYVDSLIQEGDKLISSNQKYTIKIKKLRDILKKIRIVGFVAEKVYSSRIICYNYEFFDKSKSKSEIKEDLEQYILNHATGRHITREDLRMVIKDVDFTKVLIDIENLKEASENGGMGRV